MVRPRPGWRNQLSKAIAQAPPWEPEGVSGEPQRPLSFENAPFIIGRDNRISVELVRFFLRVPFA